MDYVFLCHDHPEAHGRTPISGEVEYTAEFTTDTNDVVRVKMGETGFQNHTQIMLDMMADAPSSNYDGVPVGANKEGRVPIDRLPEEKGQYLVALKYSDLKVAMDDYVPSAKKFWNWGHRVTHWRFAPAPPTP